MKRVISLAVILMLLATSCDLVPASTSTKSVSINGEYSLDVPTFLKKATDLNDEASLQMQNGFREFYVVVLDEPVEDITQALALGLIEEEYSNGITGYSELVSSNLMESLTYSKNTEITDLSINTFDAQVFEIEGEISDIEVYYNYHVVQAQEKYYQIICWTLLGRKEKYKESMNKIAESFQLL